MENHANSQHFDSDRFGDGLRQKSLISYLEDKYQDRPYHDENRWWYQLTVYASYIFQIINIASGFAKPFAYLSGIFSFGIVGGFFAAIVAAFFVVGIEWAARKNLIQLFEKKYFKNRVNAGRIFAQMLLGSAIVALSFWGADDAVKIMSGAFVASSPTLENEEQVKEHYGILITSAQKDADAFFAASNWRGKLSPTNQRRYNDLLAQKSKYQADMNTALKEAADRNRLSVQSARDADQLALMEKQQKDAHNGSVLAVVALFSCALFVACIWLKEFYEYRTATELTHAGVIKNPQFEKILSEAEQSISDIELRREFTRKAASNGIQNAAAPMPASPGAQFRWPSYGQSKASLTPRPDPDYNPVPQPAHPVAQQAQVVSTGADQVLQLLKTNLQREMANFNNRQARPETVAKRIYSHLYTTYQCAQSPDFKPSRAVVANVYGYLVESVFPVLNERGWPWENDKFFCQRLLDIMPADYTKA